MTRRGWAGTGRFWLACGGAAAFGVAVAVGPTYWVHRASGRLLFTVDTVPPRPLPRVAVVLGAQVRSDGAPSLFLQGRLNVARALYDAGLVDVLLVSGGGTDGPDSEPEAMRRYLVDRGVPARQILLDRGGVDTFSSCTRAQQMFALDSITVISQTYHLPRALAICRTIGLDAVGVGDDSMRRYASVWRRGQLREYAANIKAAADLVTRRRVDRTAR